MSSNDNGRGIFFYINKTIDYSSRQQTKEYHEIIICDISIDKKMICLAIFYRTPNLTKLKNISSDRFQWIGHLRKIYQELHCINERYKSTINKLGRHE